MNKVFSTFFSVFVFLFSTNANAQLAPDPQKLDIVNIRTTMDKGHFLYTPTLDMPSHLEYGFNFLFSPALDPFVIYNMNGDSPGSIRSKPVSLYGMSEIGGYIGLFDDYLVGASIPIGFINGAIIDKEGLEQDKISSFAWGDFTLHAKGMFYGLKEYNLNFGAEAKITLPTGRFSKTYTGEYWPVAFIHGLTQWKQNKLEVAAYLGALIRLHQKETEFFDDKFDQGTQISYGFGASYQIIKHLYAQIELAGRSGFSTSVHDHPLEAGLGAAYYLGKGITLQAGVNGGIIAGLGTPMVRFLAGVKWTPNLKDSDHDGIPDEEDKCPFMKEDLDGFNDSDGCPDRDNDNDGIPDVKDKCPDKPEDIDMFQDDDGCPDYDNDNDGIPDTKDNCPSAKGPASNRGCPASMIDSDDDGVADAKDKCPKVKGDKSREGCPADQYDADKDGFTDNIDKCPKEAGPDKYQGCPASKFDTDNDGVTDDKDKCPNKPETINGNKDFDGCPDRGKPWYKLGMMKIAGMEQAGIIFKLPRRFEWFKGRYGRSNKLTKKAEKALGQVVLVLKTNKAIKKLLVMVFTDTLISSAKAQKVTSEQVKTLKKWLISHGLSAKRLDIQAFGNEMPVYKGSSRSKQRRNRRVLFILKAD